MDRIRTFSRGVVVLAVLLLTGWIVSALYSWRQEPTNDAYLYLAIVLFALLAFNLFALMQSVSFQIRYALLMLSISFSLYTIEIVLSLRQRQGRRVNSGPHFEAARNQGVAFDSRTRFEVVHDLRKAGDIAYPSFFATYWIEGRGNLEWREALHPINGISEVRTVYCNEGGEYSVYQSDEHGFTNRTGLYVPDRVAVVFVGDSFTQGACLQSGEDMGERFRQAGINAINFGLGGNGPLAELATIRDLLRHCDLDRFCGATTKETISIVWNSKARTRYLEST